MDHTQLLTTMLGSAVGAAIAGFVAVRVALSKLRRSRAFDKRIQWYEMAIEKLHALMLYVGWVAVIEDIYGTDDAAQRLEGSLVEAMKISQLKEEAESYGSQEVYDALQVASNCVHDLHISAVGVSNRLKEDEGARAEFCSLVREGAHHLGRVRSALVDELRSEFGMKPLVRSYSWDWEASEKRRSARREASNLLDEAEEGEWLPLDMGLIRRVLTRRGRLASSEERRVMASDLRRYADELEKESASGPTKSP